MTQDNHLRMVEHLVSLLKHPNFKKLGVVQVGNPNDFELAGTGHGEDHSEVFIALAPVGVSYE